MVRFLLQYAEILVWLLSLRKSWYLFTYIFSHFLLFFIIILLRALSTFPPFTLYFFSSFTVITWRPNVEGNEILLFWSLKSLVLIPFLFCTYCISLRFSFSLFLSTFSSVPLFFSFRFFFSSFIVISLKFQWKTKYGKQFP